MASFATQRVACLSFGASKDSLSADRRIPPPQRARSGATSGQPSAKLRLQRMLRRVPFPGIIETFWDLKHTILYLTQNEWQIGAKWALQIFEAPAASGISLDLPVEFCNLRQRLGASRMQWAPSSSKVLHSSAIFAPFKRVRTEAVHTFLYDIKSHQINLNQRINIFHRVQKMWRSIGKLRSLKHLLNEVGASDASNRGKSVSWVHSSAYKRRIGNACVQQKKLLFLLLL
jgi:hypothetical protein